MMIKKPLTLWIIAEENVKIIYSYCDCMVGLGKTRSHVASLLWAIKSGVQLEIIRLTIKKLT